MRGSGGWRGGQCTRLRTPEGLRREHRGTMGGLRGAPAAGRGASEPVSARREARTVKGRRPSRPGIMVRHDRLRGQAREQEPTIRGLTGDRGSEASARYRQARRPTRYVVALHDRPQPPGLPYFRVVLDGGEPPGGNHLHDTRTRSWRPGQLHSTGTTVGTWTDRWPALVLDHSAIRRPKASGAALRMNRNTG